MAVSIISKSKDFSNDSVNKQDNFSSNRQKCNKLPNIPISIQTRCKSTSKLSNESDKELKRTRFLDKLLNEI